MSRFVQMGVQPGIFLSNIARSIGEGQMIEGAQPLGDAAVERAVLVQAMSQMTGWISMLPESSEWRSAFLCSRRELASFVGLSHVSLLQTPPLDRPV